MNDPFFAISVALDGLHRQVNASGPFFWRGLAQVQPLVGFPVGEHADAPGKVLESGILARLVRPRFVISQAVHVGTGPAAADVFVQIERTRRYAEVQQDGRRALALGDLIWTASRVKPIFQQFTQLVAEGVGVVTESSSPRVILHRPAHGAVVVQPLRLVARPYANLTLSVREQFHPSTRSPRTFAKSRSCVTNASALIDNALAT